MSPDQLHILQHSLGLDQYGQGSSYRNHFVTGEGSTDYADCMALVDRGYMTRRLGNALSGGGDVFTVTELGRDAVRNHSLKPPQITRAQQRYRDFLAYDGSMSFGEYLRWKTGALGVRGEA